MPQSFYEINVAKDGSHLFATADRSGVHLDNAKSLYNVLLLKFPVSEGYSITVSYWKSVGREVDPTTWMGDPDGKEYESPSVYEATVTELAIDAKGRTGLVDKALDQMRDEILNHPLFKPVFKPIN